MPASVFFSFSFWPGGWMLGSIRDEHSVLFMVGPFGIGILWFKE